jgi:hemoglobin
MYRPRSRYSRRIFELRTFQKGANVTGTIYERLGGDAAINAAVDIFYNKVMEDPHINGFFVNVDRDALRAKQKMFLTLAFGGPNRYTGRGLRAAHSNAVRNGLTDSHFDAVARNLQATLDELNVPAALAGEVMAILASAKNDVLGR